MKQFIKFLSIAVIAFLFLTATAFAEKVTFVKEYNYNASDLDSKVSSRTIALEQVKRLLLEELGTYLISETEVKNFRLTKDQITTYSAGVVSAEVVDEKWDGKTYYLKAKVAADPVEVAKSLQNIANDKQKSKDLEDIRKKATKFSKEIERLKKELEIAKADTKKPEQKADAKKDEGKVYTNQDLIKQYNQAVKGLSATTETLHDMFIKRVTAWDWFDKGNAFLESRNYNDAINAYNKAIQLNPNNDVAYLKRGVAHFNLGNYQQAINDYNMAINDYNMAIQLNPQYADTYNGRGVAYGKLGNSQKAINDFNKAIELNPQYAEAYSNRAVVYFKLGDEHKAVDNVKSAAKLGNKMAQDFLKKKGIGW